MKSGIISYEKALKKIKNIGEVIIKPSVETKSGENVRLLKIENGIDVFTDDSIENIIKKYKENYIIQEKIKQNKSLSKLNPSSVNTLRLHTYVCEGKVYATPVVIRLGRNGSIIDNACAGGISVGISENGELLKYAFTAMGEKFERHPDTKILFEGYKIPRIKDMIEFTKKYHYKIPHIGIIAWDITLDEDENMVLIEANITGPGIWITQYNTGKGFFGKNTEKMIRMLKDK